MKKFTDFIVSKSKLIVLVSFLLCLVSVVGYVNTKKNYDILVYLPEDIETIKGQNILTDDFQVGAFSFVTTGKMSNYDILKLEDKIKDIDGVTKVMSAVDLIDVTIPIEMIPEKIKDKLYKEGETLILVIFDSGTSDERTINAVKELRSIVDAERVSGMTSMVLDTMELSNQEVLVYIVIAVSLCLIVLLFATGSYIIPVLLLLNIGVAILYNMGSNIFLGNISYITKAISAVLQLGVTTDFSIFLYHKYEESKKEYSNKSEAMKIAIKETFNSVIGSSLTTIAGFLALCMMDLSLGTDIGIVMAKGVLFGLICVMTLFPALLLTFDKQIEKTKHKNIFPKFTSIQKFTIKHYKLILIIFVILLIPAIYGNNKVNVYYKLDESLPDNLPSSIANSKLSEKFNITSPEIILIDNSIRGNKLEELVDRLKNVDGIDWVLAPLSITDLGIPESMISEDILKIFKNDKYQLIILNSNYSVASTELNNQISLVNNIIKEYDENSILAGEGALTKDLIDIADHDFKMVNYASIIVIFIIMLFVLKSVSLPIILISIIEFAIFTNMGISYYTNTTLPFIASIVIGTIQLGATIDYAILMSTKYLAERKSLSKEKAIKNTLASTVPAIITSSLSLFAATFGVFVYSKIDMISSICELLARGSIISMLVVIFILPAILIVADKIVVKRSETI